MPARLSLQALGLVTAGGLLVSDILAAVMMDIRGELAALPLEPTLVVAITKRVEQRQRHIYGGDEQYICKCADRESQHSQMAGLVAGGESVQQVAQRFGVAARTVYRAVRAHSEKFGGGTVLTKAKKTPGTDARD